MTHSFSLQTYMFLIGDISISNTQAHQNIPPNNIHSIRYFYKGQLLKPSFRIWSSVQVAMQIDVSAAP